MINYLKVY